MSEREQLREIESARLEKLLAGLWMKATTATDPEHLTAVKTALGLIDRHARLWGLDAPQEIVVHSPTTAEIDSWVAAMLATADGGTVIEGDILAIESSP